MMLSRAMSLLLMMAYATAVPSCTYYAEDKSALVCLPSNKDTHLVLSRKVVSDNAAIKSIALKNCKISSVDCPAFQGLPDLINLDLSDNSIEILMPCVLEGLQQLTHLNLSYNKLTQLKFGFLDKVNSIEVLDMKGNQIETFDPNFFHRLTNLKELDLSNNAIQSARLDRHMFEHNRQLKSLDFSRNDMSGASEDILLELTALETLKLDRSFLTEVPSFARKPNLKTLKILILTTNQISHLDDPTIFVNLDNLEILNLGYNAIESVAENVFSPLRRVKTIVLKHNQLKQLPEKLFQNMPKLVSIDLAYNVLEKIEVSPFRNTPMKNLNISGNKFTYLPENFCQQLRNSGGKLKKFLFSPNPWQCPCLMELIDEVTRFDLVYNNARYDGKEIVCSSNKESFSCIRS